MRNKEDLYLRNLLMGRVMVEELQEQRNQLRQDAKRNIQKIQENKRTYDRKRKRAPRYRRRLSGHPENTIRSEQIIRRYVKSLVLRDHGMASRTVGKLCSLRFRIIRIFSISSVLRERYVRDGGLKRTELNLEANIEGTRSV
ncbi:hypothetical protein TNCV_2210021 [Trichonephila clavipes]|nr:hypothetical protein TNCV_2210021 [Trichonephila clavipes]